jgi:hypothetical protein
MRTRSTSPSASPSAPRARVPAAPPGGLAVPAPPARLVALLREHGRLLTKIGHKKRDLAKLAERIRDLTQRLVATQPVIDECARLDREIHALFAELLARKRQARETRRMLIAVYGMLQDAGVLSSADDLDGGDDDDDFEDASDFSGRGAGPDGAGPHGQGGRPPAGAGGFSARRPGDEPKNQTLRGVFRDLASALHPDKVSGEAEKARRTELMKEISRAYEDRDLARLLELKRRWMQNGEAAGDATMTARDAADETQRRCANLVRMNAALRLQLQELNRQIKELRRSPPGQMLKDVRRPTRGRGLDASEDDPIAVLIAGAHAELTRTRELRDFVLSYRDGKLTIDEFLRGPPSLRRPESSDGDEVDPDDDELDRELDSLFDPSPRRRSGRRGARSREVRF